MPPAGRTFDLHVFVGDDDFLIDFSEVFRGGSIVGSMEGERAPFNHNRYSKYVPTAAGADPELAAIYTGDQTDALRNRLPFDDDSPPWGVFVDGKGAFFYCMGVFIPGLPETGPSTGILVEALPMRASSARNGYAFAHARAVTPFRFSSTDDSESIGNCDEGDEVFLVVSKVTGNPAAQTFNVAGEDRTGVDAPGIWHIGSLANNVASASVSIPAHLPAGQVIEGFALVGEKLGL